MNDLKHAIALLNQAKNILERLSFDIKETPVYPLADSGIPSLIKAAIEDKRVGFLGGWVSSVHFDQLLEDNGLAGVPPNSRRAILNQAGYDWHPALENGRVNNGLACDFGKKSRLYVTIDHPDMATRKASEVARAYEAAQI